MKPNHEWSNRELHLLHKNYANVSNDDMALIIGTRTASAINHKAHKEGLKKSNEFLNSPASGRFQPVIPFWVSVAASLQHITPLYYVHLAWFRRHIKEGQHVSVQVNKYTRMKMEVKYRMNSSGKLTLYNSRTRLYEHHELKRIFPIKKSPEHK